MYAAMTRGTTIRDLCQRFNPSNLRINERKLVQFGVLEEIIRRVHKYPIFLGDNQELQNPYQELQAWMKFAVQRVLVLSNWKTN